MNTYALKFCAPTPDRNAEIDYDQSFAGRLIPNDELNNALNANS